MTTTRKLFSAKFLKNYGPAKTLERVDATGKMSHNVVMRYKIRSAKPDSKKHLIRCYLKPENNAITAMREVIAQEFFRLMVPGHPKTRLIIDDATNQMYVSSQEVPNATPTEKMYRANLHNGIARGYYYGLGHASVMALFMNERDFKLGNIVLSKDPITGRSQFIKLDGDLCFASLVFPKKDATGKEIKHPSKYFITESILRKLPYCGDYLAYNWLDVRMEDKLYTSMMLDPSISNDERMRKEINEQLLKILCFPDRLITEFISTYTSNPKMIAELSEILLERKKQIFNAAMINDSFRTYLSSDNATIMFEEFKNNVLDFEITSHQKFIAATEALPTASLMDLNFSALQIELLYPNTTQLSVMDKKPKMDESDDDSGYYTLTKEQFNNALQEYFNTRFFFIFSPPTSDAMIELHGKMKIAQGNRERWQLAYRFIHLHSDDAFAKHLRKELETIPPQNLGLRH